MYSRIRDSPATVAFLVAVWAAYFLRLTVTGLYGRDVAVSVFVVQYSGLERVWTWFLAPVGHANPAHLLLNSVIAVYVVPEAERAFGFAATSASFLVGGAITAVGGTVLVVLVRSPFLADATGAAGIGSSMGLFVLAGMTLERYRSGSVSIRGHDRFLLRNSTVFVLLLAVSVLGVAVDIVRKTAGVPVPGLGHHYHVVGLLVGWLGSGLAGRS